MNEVIVGFGVQTYFLNQVHFQKLTSKTVSKAIDEVISYHVNWETDKIQRLMLLPQYHTESFLT